MGGFVMILFIAGIFVAGGIAGWASHASETKDLHEKYKSAKEMENHRRERNLQLRKELALQKGEIVDVEKNPNHSATIDEWKRGILDCPGYPEDPNDPRVKHIQR